MTIWPAGMTIFATNDMEDAIREAKIFIEFHKFTSEDVKIMRRENMVVVETKRAVTPHENIGAESFFDFLDARKGKLH